MSVAQNSGPYTSNLAKYIFTGNRAVHALNSSNTSPLPLVTDLQLGSV